MNRKLVKAMCRLLVQDLVKNDIIALKFFLIFTKHNLLENL